MNSFNDMSNEAMKEYFKQINNPYYLPTKSLTMLYDEVYKPKIPVIENLLYSDILVCRCSKSW